MEKQQYVKFGKKNLRPIFLDKKKIEEFFNNTYKKDFNVHNNWILDNVDFF